jgi:hypothetical protein
MDNRPTEPDSSEKAVANDHLLAVLGWRAKADHCESEIARSKEENPKFFLSTEGRICYEQAARTLRACADELAPVIEEFRSVLLEAEAGLEFAGADKEPAGQFVPSPTLALRIVREALQRISSANSELSQPRPE